MNASKRKLALLLCLFCLTGSVHARVVTLTVAASKTNDSITIGTNETATVLTGEAQGFVFWEKDGLSFGGLSSNYFADRFNPGNNGHLRLVLAGPAVIRLVYLSPLLLIPHIPNCTGGTHTISARQSGDRPRTQRGQQHLGIQHQLDPLDGRHPRPLHEQNQQPVLSHPRRPHPLMNPAITLRL